MAVARYRMFCLVLQCKRRLFQFYTQKVANFVFKDSSSPVNASNFNLLKPEFLTLYRRPNPIKIWQTYAVPPTTMLYPRSAYDLWRVGSYPTIFQPVEKLIPLTTTSQNLPDQPPLYFRPPYALPAQNQLIADPSMVVQEQERAGGWSALRCEWGLTQQLRTDLGPSVGVTATELELLNRLMEFQPSH